jgi:hypothetical protein
MYKFKSNHERIPNNLPKIEATSILFIKQSPVSQINRSPLQRNSISRAVVATNVEAEGHSFKKIMKFIFWELV